MNKKRNAGVIILRLTVILLLTALTVSFRGTAVKILTALALYSAESYIPCSPDFNAEAPAVSLPADTTVKPTEKPHRSLRSRSL